MRHRNLHHDTVRLQDLDPADFGLVGHFGQVIDPRELEHGMQHTLDIARAILNDEETEGEVMAA